MYAMLILHAYCINTLRDREKERRNGKIDDVISIETWCFIYLLLLSVEFLSFTARCSEFRPVTWENALSFSVFLALSLPIYAFMSHVISLNFVYFVYWYDEIEQSRFTHVMARWYAIQLHLIFYSLSFRYD